LDQKESEEVVGMLAEEVGLSLEEATLYVKILKEGSFPLRRKGEVQTLTDKGMLIVAGDNSKLIPVHPRLAVANSYRTWREEMVREINERRMRVDKLILKLIPVYEGAMEKRLKEGSRGKGGR
jgi:hypothetical protein